MARRNLLAECGGARSGTNVDTDRPDVVASRRGDRYVWARLTRQEYNGAWVEVTMWDDGRVTLSKHDPDGLLKVVKP